ncbi:MAG: hypothetical protein K2F87_02270 [Muribaculaceae bacterium]|nr:hypothetical protein [Muribaculaceae bacterium]
MRKPLHYLCAAMLAAVALPAAAQSADAPQVIIVGENTVTDPQAHLTFTATEDCVVTLDGINLAYDSLSYTENGVTVEIGVAGDTYPDWCKFGAEANVTYDIYLDRQSYQMPTTFTCEVSPVKTFGYECSDPVVLNGGDEVLVNTNPNVPVYLSYTAKAEERFILACGNPIQTVNYGSGCGDLEDDIPYNFEYPDYKYEILLSEGETVVLKCNNYSPVYATVRVEEVVPGASCKDAFKTTEGENVIPAEAGGYWYVINFPDSKKSMLVVSSDAELPVTLYNSCDYLYSGTDYTTPNFRYGPVNASDTRLLYIEKSEATAAAESFKLEFADLLPIEDREVGEKIEDGVAVNVPGENLTYYYSITAPEGDPTLMVVTSDYEGYGRPLTAHPAGIYYATVGTGANFKGEVTPGVTYIVEASGTTDAPFSFTVTFVALEDGQLESHPIDLAPGANKLPDFSPVYYRYESSAEAKLHLTTDLEGTTVSVKEGYNTIELDPENMTFTANASKSYILVVTKPEGKESDPCTLTVSQLDFAPGESWSTAIEMKDGRQDLPDGPFNVWYQVTATQDGFFYLENNMPYDYANATYAYVGTVSDASRVQMNTTGSWPDYKYDELKAGVAEGDVVYVNVVNTTNESDAYMTYSFKAADPGQVASNPIVIEFTAPSMDYEFQPNLNQYKEEYYWYSIELPDGFFSCTSESSMEVTLYHADDPANYIATKGWLAASLYGLRNVEVAAGKYLIRVTNTPSEAAPATISVKDPEPGQVAATAVELDLGTIPADFTCPSLDGDSYWVKFNAYPGDLSILSKESTFFMGYMYSESDLINAVASLGSVQTASGYTYGLNDYKVTEAGVYYVNFTMNYQAVDVVFSGSALETPFEGTMVNVDVLDGQSFSLQLPNNIQSAFALALPADFNVTAAELNGEEIEVSDNLYQFVTAGEDLNYVFTVDYTGQIEFVDTTTGVVKIDAKVAVQVIDGKIRIENTAVGDHVSVYTVGGLLMGNYTAQNTALEIELPSGTYIVLVNGSAAKVLL